MVAPDWNYLVRSSKGVFLIEKKPKGLKISVDSFTWSVNGLEFKIGCPDPDCLLNVEDWSGPIGVININNQVQVRRAFTLMRNHIIDMAHRELKKNLQIRKVDLVIKTGDQPEDLRHTAVGGGVHETFTFLMQMNSLSSLNILVD